jgi:hypothetical protein
MIRLVVCRGHLSQLDTADRQEPSDVLGLNTTRLKEKLDKLKEEMGKLAAYEKQMLASPDGQISLTDPDSRSMATSGRGSGVVGYNVQVAVDTVNHLIVTHEVTNTGSDRSQLANVAREAKAVLQVDKLEAVADRGYFDGEETRVRALSRNQDPKRTDTLAALIQGATPRPGSPGHVPPREAADDLWAIRTGATHFLMKRPPRLRATVAIKVLTYNRVGLD